MGLALAILMLNNGDSHCFYQSSAIMPREVKREQLSATYQKALRELDVVYIKFDRMITCLCFKV